MDFQWFDHNGDVTAKLAKIQIHIGTFTWAEPVHNIRFRNIQVYDKGTSYNPETENPIIFKTGDKITIDNDKAIVLKNGEPIFTALDPSSDFISLKKGTNGLVISPPVADVKVTFRERWL
jgi:phage-related protein